MFADKLLFFLLAKRLNVREKGSTRVTSLDIKPYTQETFYHLNIKTVQDAVLAFCLHQKTPGLGEGSWNDFFNAVR